MKYILGALSLFVVIVFFSYISDSNLYKNDHSNSFDVLELKLSDADLEHFYKTQQESIKNLHISPELNRWRNAKLSINKKKYKVKVRFHGTDHEHAIIQPYSFAIKLRKGEYYKGMNRFSLIMPQQEFIVDQVFFHFLDVFYNFKVHTGLYNFIVNGQPNGVTFLEEKLDKTLLEKNQMSNSDVFKTLDNWRDNKYQVAHIEPFSYIRSNIRTKSISNLSLGQTESYFKLFELSNGKEIFNLIDKNYFAKMDAYRLLFGKAHAVAGDNLQLIYDTTSGKFSPYLRPEGTIVRLIGDNHYDLSVNAYIYNQNIKRDSASYNPLFWNLSQNEEYILIRNKYLSLILDKENEVLEYFDSIEKSYLDIASVNSSLQFQIGNNNDKVSNLSNYLNIDSLKKKSYKYKTILRSNFSHLRDYVENYPY